MTDNHLLIQTLNNINNAINRNTEVLQQFKYTNEKLTDKVTELCESNHKLCMSVENSAKDVDDYIEKGCNIHVKNLQETYETFRKDNNEHIEDFKSVIGQLTQTFKDSIDTQKKNDNSNQTLLTKEYEKTMTIYEKQVKYLWRTLWFMGTVVGLAITSNPKVINILKSIIF